jgi:hypothetical protein
VFGEGFENNLITLILRFLVEYGGLPTEKIATKLVFFWFKWGCSVHQSAYQCCYLVEIQFCTFFNFSALHNALDESRSANSFNFAPSFEVGRDAPSFEIGGDFVNYIYLFFIFTKKTPWTMCSYQVLENQRFETFAQCKD